MTGSFQGSMSCAHLLAYLDLAHKHSVRIQEHGGCNVGCVSDVHAATRTSGEDCFLLSLIYYKYLPHTPTAPFHSDEFSICSKSHWLENLMRADRHACSHEMDAVIAAT